MIQTKAVYDEQLKYWQNKCELLEQQKKSSNEQTKKNSHTKQVLHSLVLSVRVLSVHVYCLLSSSLLLPCFVVDVLSHLIFAHQKGTDSLSL